MKRFILAMATLGVIVCALIGVLFVAMFGLKFGVIMAVFEYSIITIVAIIAISVMYWIGTEVDLK